MENIYFEAAKEEILKEKKYNTGKDAIDFLILLLSIKYPILSVVKDLKCLVENRINDFQKKKRDDFCDIVLSNVDLVTTDKVNDVDFVMEFAKTVDVVNRLVQSDKVKYFANLFKKSFIDSDSYNLDRYEEYLHRLEYLSYQEISFLIELYKYSKVNEKKYHGEWYDFKKLIATKYHLSENIVVDIFSGLCMTGFVRRSDVLFPSDGDVENPYYVTEYFEDFVKYIDDEI